MHHKQLQVVFDRIIKHKNSNLDRAKFHRRPSNARLHLRAFNRVRVYVLHAWNTARQKFFTIVTAKTPIHAIMICRFIWRCAKGSVKLLAVPLMTPRRTKDPWNWSLAIADIWIHFFFTRLIYWRFLLLVFKRKQNENSEIWQREGFTYWDSYYLFFRVRKEINWSTYTFRSDNIYMAKDDQA